MGGSSCPFASFSPTVPLLSLLCHRFFPVINFLPLPRCTTPGINHRLPWRRSHPCEVVGVRVIATPVACQRACVCAACRLYLPLHPSGDAGAPPARVAVTAVWSGSSHLTHSASSCTIMTEHQRRGDDKKDTERCQARFASPRLRKLTRASIIIQLRKVLTGHEQRKLRCSGSPVLLPPHASQPFGLSRNRKQQR